MGQNEELKVLSVQNCLFSYSFKLTLFCLKINPTKKVTSIAWIWSSGWLKSWQTVVFDRRLFFITFQLVERFVYINSWYHLCKQGARQYIHQKLVNIYTKNIHQEIFCVSSWPPREIEKLRLHFFCQGLKMRWVVFFTFTNNLLHRSQTSIFFSSLFSTEYKVFGLEWEYKILVSSAKSRSSINSEAFGRSFM